MSADDQHPAHETPDPAQAPSFFADAIDLELEELTTLLTRLSRDEVKPAVMLLTASKRIFTFGAGRSGLALRMVAMRLMHFGLSVHVAGETTTPAIGKGDLLLVASASGSSASAVHAAEVARAAGASVLAITAQPESPLAQLATRRITLKAATKNEFGQRASAQYAGSLFEQGVLLLGDAIFHGMWQASGIAAETLMQRHANLE